MVGPCQHLCHLCSLKRNEIHALILGGCRLDPKTSKIDYIELEQKILFSTKVELQENP